MAQLLVRDIPSELVDELKRRAARHGRSAEAEHRAILTQALSDARRDFRERAARSRAETGPLGTDSAKLIREDRDRNWQ